MRFARFFSFYTLLTAQGKKSALLKGTEARDLSDFFLSTLLTTQGKKSALLKGTEAQDLLDFFLSILFSLPRVRRVRCLKGQKHKIC